MYIVTHENIDDGVWFDDPMGFDSEDQARQAAAKLPPPMKGYCRVLYRCDEIGMISENRG